MMKRIIQSLANGRGFLGDVQQELKKCAWPTRSELVDSTVVVIVAVLILGVFVGLSDTVIAGLLNWIIR